MTFVQDFIIIIIIIISHHGICLLVCSVSELRLNF